MPELQWLEKYSGQSVDDLLALEGQNRIDSLVVAFEQAMDQKANRVGMEQLSDEERVILAIEALEREVHNGGYHQFFLNSSREYSPIIVQSLHRIGCPRIAEITQLALDSLNLSQLTVEGIESVMMEENEARDEVLSECNSRFLTYPENIEQSLFAFIKCPKSKIEC